MPLAICEFALLKLLYSLDSELAPKAGFLIIETTEVTN